MKKHYLPVAILMMAFPACLNAQQVSPAAGTAQTERHAPQTSLPDGRPARSSSTPSAPKVLNPYAEAARKGLLAPDPVNPDVKKDSLVLTQVEKSNNGRPSTVDIAYDEYGRRTLIKEGASDGSTQETTRYTYTTDAYGRWTSRLCEVAEEDGIFHKDSKEERTFDSQLNLTQVVLYEYDEDGNVKYTQTELYDYAHPVYDAQGHATYGHLLKRSTIYSDQTSESLEYQWMEHAQQYVRVLQEAAGSKTTAEATANGYKTKTYYTNYDTGQPYLAEEKEWYVMVFAPGIILDTGGFSTRYDTDGAQTYIGGSKTIIERDTPEAGAVRSTHYNWNGDSGEWEPYFRTDTKGLSYANTDANSIIADDAKIDNYQYTNGSFNLSSGFTYHHQTGQLWKVETYIGGVTLTSYLRRQENGTFSIGTSLMLSDTEGILFEGSYSEGDFASNNGELGERFNTSTGFTGIRVIRQRAEILTPWGANAATGYINDFYKLYIQTDGEWIPQSLWESTNTDGVTTVRSRYTLDSEGRPQSAEIFTTEASHNEGKEFASQRVEFNYGDRSLEITNYGATDSYTLAKSESYKYELLDDNAQQETSYSYTYSGKIDEARRYINRKGAFYTYEYNSQTGNFEENYVSAKEYSEVAADGTRTTYSMYSLDENNQPIFSGKQEVRTVYDGNVRIDIQADYDYDYDNGQWVGTNYTESYSVKLPVPYYTSPVNPYDNYSDEYVDGFQYGSSRYLQKGIEEYITFSREWNASAGHWEPEGKLAYTYSAPNAHEASFTLKTEDGQTEVASMHIQTNEADDLLLLERNIDDRQRRETYTYNTQGMLTGENREDGYNTYKATYIYSLQSVYATGIDQARGADMGLTLKDDVISAPEGTPLSLYDASGRLAAKGTGSVKAPAAGVYIVATPQGTAKILVK